MKLFLFALVGALDLTQGLLAPPSAGEVPGTATILEAPSTVSAAIPASALRAEDSGRPIVLVGSSTTGAAKPRYITTATIKPRSGKGKGARLGSRVPGSGSSTRARPAGSR